MQNEEEKGGFRPPMQFVGLIIGAAEDSSTRTLHSYFAPFDYPEDELKETALRRVQTSWRELRRSVETGLSDPSPLASTHQLLYLPVHALGLSLVLVLYGLNDDLKKYMESQGPLLHDLLLRSLEDIEDTIRTKSGFERRGIVQVDVVQSLLTPILLELAMEVKNLLDEFFLRALREQEALREEEERKRRDEEEERKAAEEMALREKAKEMELAEARKEESGRGRRRGRSSKKKKKKEGKVSLPTPKPIPTSRKISAPPPAPSRPSAAAAASAPAGPSPPPSSSAAAFDIDTLFGDVPQAPQKQLQAADEFAAFDFTIDDEQDRTKEREEVREEEEEEEEEAMSRASIAAEDDDEEEDEEDIMFSADFEDFEEMRERREVEPAPEFKLKPASRRRAKRRDEPRRDAKLPSQEEKDISTLLREQDQMLDTLNENIDKVLSRGEKLDSLEERSETLEGSAEVFRAAAMKKKPKKEKKKKKKTKIDDVFADMENAFNGLSAMLVSVERSPHASGSKLGYCLKMFIPAILIYSLVSFVSLAVVLPACLVLLLFRTAVVERKVDQGFAVRQRVLAAESASEKTCRFISLLLRSLPMLFFVGGYPVLAVYYLIPKYDRDPSFVLYIIGSYVCIVVVMQILGTIRSVYSHNEKKKELMVRSRNAPSPPPGASEHAPPAEYRFRWSKWQNWVALLTLLVETMQLATFSLQTLNENTGSIDDAASSVKQGGGGFISDHIIPQLFLDIGGWLSQDIHLTYAYFSFAVTGLLVLVFLLQLLFQLRRFGYLKRYGIKQDANDAFFYSFVGSIIYGHGEVKNISSKVAAIVTILADTLFLVVCSKLLLLVTCVERTVGGVDRLVLLVSEDVTCWSGEHNFIATGALISFGIYLPLATMIAPMLVESDTPPPPPGPTQQPPSKVWERKKDISYIKPFLSAIAVGKCIMLVAGTFMGHDDPYVTVIATSAIMVALFLVTFAWSLQPAQHSLLFHEMNLHPKEIERLQGGLGEPCIPAPVNITRSLSFLGGVWGGAVAMIAFHNPQKYGGDTKFVILGMGCGLLFFIGSTWYASWKRKNRFSFTTRSNSMDRLSHSGVLSSEVSLSDLSEAVTIDIEEVEMAPVDKDRPQLILKNNQWRIVMG